MSFTLSEFEDDGEEEPWYDEGRKSNKDNGKMVCSGFHPFTKISDILDFEQPTMSYFSKEVFEGEMAHPS